MSEIETRDKDLFNRIGQQYASKDTYPPSSNARRFQAETLMEFIAKAHGKSKFKNILDIGCGNGATALYLEKYYDMYTGIDHSAKLIEIATGSYGTKKARFLSTNIKDFGEYSGFDLIMGNGILHHITDLEGTLKWLRGQCNDETVFAFIEPQRGNPAIQLMRRIRKLVDKNYSEDQVFFLKSELARIFNGAGFRTDKLYYFGYFSVPFAQVILKPQWVFNPVSRICINIDRWIQNRWENRMSWIMMIIASIRS